MREISEVVEQIKNKESNIPVELYQLFLRETTLYWAMWPEDVEFFDENGNPQIYSAKALGRGDIKNDVETKIKSVDVSIDNVNREMSAYAANTEIRGCKLRILKVFWTDNKFHPPTVMFGMAEQDQIPEELNGLSSIDDAIVMFEGNIDSPKFDQYVMSIEVRSDLDKLSRQLPRRKYEPQCNWRFGDPETCGVSIPEKNSQIDSVSSDLQTIYDDAISESNDYWNHGKIKIGSESRKIVDQGEGYIKIEYPFRQEIKSGDNYYMKAGCDYSYDGGHGCSFWDNTQFYGGFRKIPKINNNIVKTG